MSDSSAVDFDHEALEVEEEIAFECDVCSQTLPSKENLVEHLKQHICLNSTCTSCRPHAGGSRHHLTPSSTFQLSEDEAPIRKKQTKMENACHQNSATPSKKVSMLEEKTPQIGSTPNHKYFCVECDQTFCNKQKLEKHILSHKNRESTNSSYHDEFEAIIESNHSAWSTPNHSASRHSTISKKLTPLKQESSASYLESSFDYEPSHPLIDQIGISTSRNHQPTKDRNHGISRLETSLSNAEVTSKSIMHTFFCSKCNRGFERKGNLDRHMKLHSKDSPRNRFRCGDCNLTFVSKFNLQRHETLHLPCKIFSCTICNASFANKYYLHHHLKSHSDVRRYICKECDAVFKTLYGLTLHSQKHGH